MVNHAVTTNVTAVGSFAAVAVLNETFIETIVNSKTIREIAIVPYGTGQFIGYVVVET